jgi:hypothetical protein
MNTAFRLSPISICAILDQVGFVKPLHSFGHHKGRGFAVGEAILPTSNKGVTVAFDF